MKSTINLNSINRSLSGLSESVKNANKRSEQISDNIRDRNLAKKKSISMSAEFFAKRRDNQRRKEKEDLLEAGSVMGVLKSGGKAIQRTTKGFLGRILDFVGTIILGWAILNLPKIIKITQDLIKRMQKYFGILTTFVNDVATMFTDFGNKIQEVATSLLPFNFESFRDKIQGFMNKIKNAFDQLVLNSIKTIKVFSDKTERELAKDLGLLDLYDRMNNGEPPQDSSGDSSGDSSEEKIDDEDDGSLSQDDLIKQGIEQLKIFRGGELTKNDKRRIKGKNNQQIHDYLIDGEKLILMRSKVNGTIQYMLLEDYLAENTTMGNKLDEYLEPVPSSYFSSEASSFSEVSNEDAKRIIENENKGIYDGDVDFEGRKGMVDFQFPKGKQDIEINVPVESGKKNNMYSNELNHEGLNQYSNKYNDLTIDSFKNQAYTKLGN